ncbi:MAG: hypothetical protein JW927_07285 [Deltaproteobacteria bacterium]|nr:hypothetical protein [Deltaproteobacteria bacterium]
MVCVDPWIDSTYDMLYDIFCRDIRDHDLRYFDNRVWIFREMEDGREKIFWHLTTRSEKKVKIPRRKKKFFPSEQVYFNEDRYPDLRRCERLPWIRALIEQAGDTEILAWDYEEEDLTIKTYLWLKDNDFAVIMKKFPNGVQRLITSFYIDKSYKRQDLERKYAKRIN